MRLFYNPKIRHRASEPGLRLCMVNQQVKIVQRNRLTGQSGISTYRNRATLKPGCVPSEHAVVYFAGTNPDSCYLPGERENGLNKEPIEVQPADYTLTMKPEARLRFSKTIPIEMNVKVKDIGQVHPQHLTKLYNYWMTEWSQAAAA